MKGGMREGWRERNEGGMRKGGKGRRKSVTLDKAVRYNTISVVLSAPHGPYNIMHVLCCTCESNVGAQKVVLSKQCAVQFSTWNKPPNGCLSSN
jgi:hypothetical protein